MEQRQKIGAFFVSLLISSFLMGAATQDETQRTPNRIVVSPGLTPQRIEEKGSGGGSTPAEVVAGRSETVNGLCVGFVDKTPNHVVMLTSFFKYLSLKVDSTEDTTLVVKGPGGTWCNDDFDGKNAGIAGQWLAGEYQVWIGSYNSGKSSPYVMRISDR